MIMNDIPTWERDEVIGIQTEGLSRQKQLRKAAQKDWESLSEMNLYAIDDNMRKTYLLRLAEKDEKVALATRRLIYDTTDIDDDMLNTLPASVKCETYLKGRGAHLILPPLLPKNRAGSHAAALWYAGTVRPSLNAWFSQHPIAGSDKMTFHLAITYLSLIGRRARDFDNMELKALIDVICRASHLGDSPAAYELFVQGREGIREQTEVWIMPANEFPKHLQSHGT